jgi:hypothetical protein
VKNLMMALLIWCAFSVPVALAVGRMLSGPAGANPPAPPAVRPPARGLVRS